MHDLVNRRNYTEILPSEVGREEAESRAPSRPPIRKCLYLPRVTRDEGERKDVTLFALIPTISTRDSPPLNESDCYCSAQEKKKEKRKEKRRHPHLHENIRGRSVQPHAFPPPVRRGGGAQALTIPQISARGGLKGLTRARTRGAGVILDAFSRVEMRIARIARSGPNYRVACESGRERPIPPPPPSPEFPFVPLCSECVRVCLFVIIDSRRGHCSPIASDSPDSLLTEASNSASLARSIAVPN